jgi:hypothetical protein
MKHFLAIIFLLGFVHFVRAQEHPTVEQYCSVKVFWNAFSSEASIAIDDGTKAEALNMFSQRLRDSTNRVVKFKSRVDALNYMGKQGWKMVHVVSSNTDNTEYVYLFRKEVRREE